eukprot:8672281-Pyramimonas_sp.AAC.1
MHDCGFFGPSGGPLVAIWGPLGGILGRLEPVFGRLGPILGRLRGLLAHLGVLGIVDWEALERSGAASGKREVQDPGAGTRGMRGLGFSSHAGNTLSLSGRA